MVDAHIYDNQNEAIEEYLIQRVHDLPDYTYKNGELKISNYKYSSRITAPVAV
jgi:thymidylate synthase